MAIAELFLGEIIKATVAYVTRKLNASNEGEGVPRELGESFQVNLEAAISWSGQYQIYGMPKPASVDDATIGLTLAGEPRTFRSQRTPTGTSSEDDLLCGNAHFMLLGDPGSGKTTTLKRLVRRLLKSPESMQDFCQYPVVIRLRELRSGSNLTLMIADYLGIAYTTEITPPVMLGGQVLQKGNTKCLVGKLLLEPVVHKILNDTGAVVFLDGLDEVPYELRASVRSDLQKLVFKLYSSKLIVTCRSGDPILFSEGFTFCELYPLVEAQVIKIASLWLHDTAPFVNELRRMPYADVADRPLFIVQLVLLFKRTGYLPDQPSVIYEKVVRMMIQDWDEERGIVRGSKYSGFTPDRKLAFLAALAYQLTFLNSSRGFTDKVFTEHDLVGAYERIHESFGLPASEARSVAAEIESHTGILIAGPRDTFEFAHLSLQEYLCAHYIIRASHADRLHRYISTAPAPLAIAVTLASDPSKWFSSLILQESNYRAFNDDTLSQMLTRMLMERPSFACSAELGMAILTIYETAALGGVIEKAKARMIHDLHSLLMHDSVKRSVLMALPYYSVNVSKFREGFVRLESLNRTSKLKDGEEIATPSSGAVPIDLLLGEFNRHSLAMHWTDHSGMIYEHDSHLVRQLEAAQMNSRS